VLIIFEFGPKFIIFNQNTLNRCSYSLKYCVKCGRIILYPSNLEVCFKEKVLT
jgi:hypothetical protein